MSKFLNNPADAVAESLRGFARAHSGLVRLCEAPRYVARASAAPGKVGLVSGGGSGHDPLHAGFVGTGMLDAAVPGEIFSSPSVDQILAAAEAADSGAGILCIVKNYTGDRMNFELAMELFAGEHETVIVDDDVGAAGGQDTVGRRGVAGVVVVEKIAGAAAERGAGLAEVAALAASAAAATRSMGVALGGCRVPDGERPNLDLAAGEMEVGIGIHGEPGRRRGAVNTAHEIVSELVGAILEDLAPPPGAPLLLFVNGLGGTPQMELFILYDEAVRMLEARGFRVVRSIVAPLVTSLEMPGASITLTQLDPQLAELWDDPVVTAGLRWGA